MQVITTILSATALIVNLCTLFYIRKMYKDIEYLQHLND